MSNYSSDDGARRAIEMGLELMCYKALNEIEVIFGCIADMKANFALSPTRIQQVYDYMDLPKDPFEFIDTVPEDSPEVTIMRRNLRVILDEFPTFDAYDFWFKSDSTVDWDDLIQLVRTEKKRLTDVYNKQFAEFKRRYGS